jgi:hypothetical protein
MSILAHTKSREVENRNLSSRPSYASIVAVTKNPGRDEPTRRTGNGVLQLADHEGSHFGHSNSDVDIVNVISLAGNSTVHSEEQQSRLRTPMSPQVELADPISSKNFA